MNIINTNSDIIIFGGHGDLSFRKLLPALYHLFNEKYLDDLSRIIIVTRRDITHEENIKLIKSKLQEFIKDDAFSQNDFKAFQKILLFAQIISSEILRV